MPAKPQRTSDAAADAARKSSRILASRVRGKDRLGIRIVGDATRETVQLPAPAVRLLVRILDEMADGNSVAVTAVRAELTTQQAADMLGISRPSMIQLLAQGKIDFRLVGTHRRVRFDSLIRYKRQADAARRAALAELAAYDQELGI